MSDVGEIQETPKDMIARGLGSAWERLGPLSAGAVATSLLLVTGGRLLSRAVGLGIGRRLGLSTVAGLLSLGLWLVAGPGDVDNRGRGHAAGADGTPNRE